MGGHPAHAGWTLRCEGYKHSERRSPCETTKDNGVERAEHLIDVTVVDKLLEQDVALFLAEGVGEEGHPVLCQRGRERRPVGY